MKTSVTGAKAEPKNQEKTKSPNLEILGPCQYPEVSLQAWNKGIKPHNTINLQTAPALKAKHLRRDMTSHA